VVILLNVIHLGTELVIGIVVDSVSDTYTIKPQDIKKNPKIGAHAHVGYLMGLVELGEELILLLDISKILSDAHFAQVSDLNQD